jgi:Family of unknown function (DUF5662)
MPTANEVTQAHINRVAELIGEVNSELTYRAVYHDQSKFDPIEAGPLQEMQDLIDREGQAPYGSDEYRRRTALLGPMLEHHYALNPHHPEHWSNGIASMTILDVVEMLCDWKAASERGNDPALNLTYLAQKYSIEPMLLSILQNTCRDKGWRYV